MVQNKVLPKTIQNNTDKAFVTQTTNLLDEIENLLLNHQLIFTSL